MVAGTLGDNAGAGGCIIQRQYRVAGAAEFERARALQVLAFEQELAAGEGIEAVRTQHRGDVGVAGDARSGLADIGDGGKTGGWIGHRASLRPRRCNCTLLLPAS